MSSRLALGPTQPPIQWVKVKLSLYRPWRPLGLLEVEAPTFSDISSWMAARLSALCACRFLPPGRFLLLISVRGWVNPRAIVQLEGLGTLKKSTSSGTQTGDLPACSIVPQLTTVPHAPIQWVLGALSPGGGGGTGKARDILHPSSDLKSKACKKPSMKQAADVVSQTIEFFITTAVWLSNWASLWMFYKYHRVLLITCFFDQVALKINENWWLS
jgi:hypothetical protein